MSSSSVCIFSWKSFFWNWEPTASQPISWQGEGTLHCHPIPVEQAMGSWKHVFTLTDVEQGLESRAEFQPTDYRSRVSQ